MNVGRTLKIQNRIDSGELFEVEKVLYFKNRFCKCGCGKNLKYYPKAKNSYLKGHWVNDLEYMNKRKDLFNTEEMKRKNSESPRRASAEKKIKDEKSGYITIKGGVKVDVIFIEGKKHYKNHYCKCGCAKNIAVTQSNIGGGIPNYLPNHWNLARKVEVILENSAECYKDIYCECGCGERMPTYGSEKFSGRKFIKGHLKAKTNKTLNTSEEVIKIGDDYHYLNIYCKCGCGERIKYRPSHKSTKIPDYINYHQFNDKEFMLKVRTDNRESALKRLAQRGSYGQTGTFTSEKNSKIIPYDSSYELRALSLLENDSSVISYDRCSLRIPYILDDTSHFYFPDFEVNYTDSSKLIEVKPIKFINSDKNILKFNAARYYCAQNEMTFEVWTEKDLGIRKNGTYIPS